jgi:uncharacterized protein (UPF0335 family)
MNRDTMISDLKYYLEQIERAEETARDANISVDEVLKNIKSALLDFVTKW